MQDGFLLKISENPEISLQPLLMDSRLNVNEFWERKAINYSCLFNYITSI